jgi:hypothetical protein
MTSFHTRARFAAAVALAVASLPPQQPIVVPKTPKLPHERTYEDRPMNRADRRNERRTNKK